MPSPRASINSPMAEPYYLSVLWLFQSRTFVRSPPVAQCVYASPVLLVVSVYGCSRFGPAVVSFGRGTSATYRQGRSAAMPHWGTRHNERRFLIFTCYCFLFTWWRPSRTAFYQQFYDENFDVKDFTAQSIHQGVTIVEQLARIAEGVASLDRELREQVCVHHDDLLSRVTAVETLEEVLKSMQLRIQALLSAVERSAPFFQFPQASTVFLSQD